MIPCRVRFLRERSYEIRQECEAQHPVAVFQYAEPESMGFQQKRLTRILP